MANTIPITEKPIPEKVNRDAYILGTQDNGNGQQALYRFPIDGVLQAAEIDGVVIIDNDDNAKYLGKFRISSGHPALEITKLQ